MAEFTVDEISAAPEIAAQTALLQASAAIESAVHADDEAGAFFALSDASEYLHWALDDLALAGDEDQLAAATFLSASVDQLVADGVPAGTALPTWQLQLLPLQSQIVEVATVPAAEWVAAQNQAYDSGMVAFWTVLGAALFVGASAAFIDFKQTHGGYHRGAPGIARPIVTYRYPRR